MQTDDQSSTVTTDKRAGSQQSIKILSWNLEGMFEKLNLDGVCDYIRTFEVACIGETFTYPNFDLNIKFSDYVHLHCPATKYNRLGRPSGGLVVLIKKTLQSFIKVIDTQISHILCVQFDKSLMHTSRDILFIGTYNHPTGSIFYTDKDHDSTLEALEQFILDQTEEGREFDYVIAGDLNARISDWGYTDTIQDDDDDDQESRTYTRTAQDNTTNNNGKRVIELCTTFGLTPLNGLTEKLFDDRFTFISHRGNSTIDHFLCSTNLLKHITGYKTDTRVESNHMPIMMEMQSGLRKHKQQETKPIIVKKTKWQEDKMEETKNIIESEEFSQLLAEAERKLDTDVDSSVDTFNQAMDCANKPMAIQFKVNNNRTTPKGWFDKDCINKKRETTKLLNKLSKIHAKKKKEKYNEAKKEYIEKRAEYQKLLKEKKKQYKKDGQEQLLANRKDSKQFWATVRRLNNRKQKVPNITNEEWEKHFENLLNPEKRGPDDHIDTEEVNIGQDNNTPQVIENEELDREINQEEIIKAINKLKKGKAPGLDNISPELLQAAGNTILPYLTNLFNKLFNTGTFPLRWAAAIIVPLYKKGDRDLADNYRGISLLSITSKLLTSILNTRLYKWAEDNNKINDEQAGFRRNYSTTDHIYTLHSIISNNLYGRRRCKTYVAFIDFKKAFDTVNRHTLWQILHKRGVSTKMLSQIKAIYKTVTAVVRHGSEYTREIICPLGVKQGCLLSPLLFSLLIAEVAYEVVDGGRTGYQFIPGAKELFTLLFADDIALISLTPAGLQTQINNLKRAAEKLGLVVNLEKTKIMVFRKGGYLGRLEKWYYGRERIEVVNNYKYLGYTFTTKLSVDIPLAEYTGRAKGKVVSIFRTLYKLGKIDPNIFFQLYDSQVKPMILYAAEIWGLGRNEIAEKTQLFAGKKLLGVSSKTPNIFVYVELNRYPIYIDSVVRALSYWFRLLQQDADRLSRQAYEREKRELEKGKGWGKGIKEYLETSGYGYIWLNQGTQNIDSFLRKFKQRLVDMFWQNTQNKIMNSDRFNIYRTFKTGHQREQYLVDITIPKFRKTFTKLRLGILDIRSNSRFTDPLANRNCPFCRREETETHVLLQCTMYTELRRKHIMTHWITPNNITLADLLSNTNAEITRGTATFIFHAIKKREAYM